MRTLLLLTALIATGCSFLGKDDDDPTQDWTVEKLYEEAKNALDAGYYTRAVEYYEFLETRFPFGVYGQQSLLDLAFVYYKLEKFEESLSTCDRFIRLYPQSVQVDYAYYLRGLVNFNKGKGLTDRFLPIDLSQRDSTAALQALPVQHFVIDGEIVALDETGKPSFQRLQARMGLTKPGDVEQAMAQVPVTCIVFDCLALEGYDLRRLPLVDRKTCLPFSRILKRRRGAL